MKKVDADVLIIGAGPAGSLAAATLAQAGKHVVCVERGFLPRYSIGESLLPRCNELLEKADLLSAVEKRGYMVKHGAEFHRGHEVERFVFRNGLAGTRPSTFQVPRGDFDQTLSTRARALGADVRFGRKVEAVRFSKDHAEIDVVHEERGETTTMRGSFLLDCSGYGRVLPRLLGIDRPAGMATRAAYFTMVEGDVRPEGEREGDIWVCVHPLGAWIWIIPFSDGRTSVGVVGAPELFDAIEGTDHDKLFTLLRGEPNTRERLTKAEPVLAVMKLSAWSSAVDKLYGPRWAVAGNAGDFLDPVFSSGVCVALESASRAAALVERTLAGDTPDWEASYTEPMKRAVGVFRLFVNGWYSGDVVKLFFTPYKPSRIRAAVTSVLAGYVLDENNPFVSRPEETMTSLVARLSAAEAGA